MSTCPVCNRAARTLRFGKVRDYISGESFDVFTCDDCGLGRTVDVPADTGRFYPARYRTNRQRQTASFRVRRRAREITRLFPRGYSGRVLDLGCGRGDFILHMQSAGWEVAATEIDREKVATLRAAGVDARTPDQFTDAPSWAGTFDAVTCWHVLEHVHEPGQLLRQAWDVLKPGGFLDVTVPDFASPQARRWGRNWFHLDVPRHVTHFSRDNLGRLIEAIGFTTPRWRKTAVEYDFFGELQSGLNAGATMTNELFESMTGDKTSTECPPLSRRLAAYSSAVPRSLVALPRFAWDVARGAGGTLWVTARKPA